MNHIFKIFSDQIKKLFHIIYTFVWNPDYNLSCISTNKNSIVDLLLYTFSTNDLC